MDPHSRASIKNTSHGNEVLPQVTTHLMQRPCYQWGSPCHDSAGNRTPRRPPDHRKETQTVVVWTCLPFIRFCQNHLARHSERGQEDTAERGRCEKTTSGNGQAWSSLSPRGQWRTGKIGGNWLWNLLWCPNDPSWIDGADDDNESECQCCRAHGLVATWPVIIIICYILQILQASTVLVFSTVSPFSPLHLCTVCSSCTSSVICFVLSIPLPVYTLESFIYISPSCTFRAE